MYRLYKILYIPITITGDTFIPTSATTFTIDLEVLRKFNKEVDKGNRSEVVTRLLRNYVEDNSTDKDSVEDQIKELKSDLDEIDSTIREMKSKKSNVKNRVERLKDRKKELEHKQNEENKLEDFFDEQIDKFSRHKGDFEDFKTEYSGIYDLFSNRFDLDMEKPEFWDRFEDEIRERNK